MESQTTNKMLEELVKLLHSLVGPMACTLKEIKASNRSRWIVLLSMVVIAGLVAIMSGYTLKQLNDMGDTMIEMKMQYTLTQGQLNQLLNLAEDSASTPEIEEKLRSIKRLGAPTPENIIEAVQAIPRYLPVDTGTDTIEN